MNVRNSKLRNAIRPNAAPDYYRDCVGKFLEEKLRAFSLISRSPHSGHSGIILQAEAAFM